MPNYMPNYIDNLCSGCHCPHYLCQCGTDWEEEKKDAMWHLFLDAFPAIATLLSTLDDGEELDGIYAESRKHFETWLVEQ